MFGSHRCIVVLLDGWEIWLSIVSHQACFSLPIHGELRSSENKCREWDCKPPSSNADMEGIHHPQPLTLETWLVPEFLTIYTSALTHCVPSSNACERTDGCCFSWFLSLPGTRLDQLPVIPKQCPRTYAAGLMPPALNQLALYASAGPAGMTANARLTKAPGLLQGAGAPAPLLVGQGLNQDGSTGGICGSESSL